MDKTKKSKSEWLERLQQESWQLELIVSGIVIFGLFSGIEVLQGNDHKIRTLGEGTSVIGDLLFGVVMTIWAAMYISLTNLIIHILIRSLWIGAIGLRYVSGNIDYDSLNYAPIVTNYFKKKIGSFDDYLDKLENFSSVIFSYTFLLIFIVFSILIFVFATVSVFEFAFLLFGNKGSIMTALNRILVILFLFFAFLVAVDFITLGALKRIKNEYFAKFYFYIYRFYSTITLSFLWRPMLLNFLDKKFTRRLFILAIPYLIVLLSVYQSNFVSIPYYPNLDNSDKIFLGEAADPYAFNHFYYDDERTKSGRGVRRKGVIQAFSIPSKRMEGLLGEVFIKGRPRDKYLIEAKDSTLFSLEPEGLENIFAGLSEGFNSYDRSKEALQKRMNDTEQNFQKIKDILQDAISIKIDEQLIAADRITCDFYNHADENTKGLLCFFPLDSLSTVRHYLTIGKVKAKEVKEKNKEVRYKFDTTYRTIPFIYENRYQPNN
ncbi:MAG: hypothetical protein AAGJ18_08575 [Bacteroidota bacterium]